MQKVRYAFISKQTKPYDFKSDDGKQLTGVNYFYTCLNAGLEVVKLKSKVNVDVPEPNMEEVFSKLPLIEVDFVDKEKNGVITRDVVAIKEV